MALSLGYEPQKLTVTLVHQADYVAGMRSVSGAPWPDGLEVFVQIDDEDEWQADVVDDRISWNIDTAIVQPVIDAILAGTLTGASRLWYVDGGTRLLWAKGLARIRG